MRTGYLSLFDDRTENWVGFANYRSIFTDPKSFQYANRLDLFGSRLYQIALVALLAAAAFALYRSRRSGHATELGAATVVGSVPCWW